MRLRMTLNLLKGTSIGRNYSLQRRLCWLRMVLCVAAASILQCRSRNCPHYGANDRNLGWHYLWASSMQVWKISSPG